MNKILKASRIVIISSISLYSCTKMVAPPDLSCNALKTTYTKDIAPIIHTSCAISGCHDGMAYLGNYNSYDVLKVTIDSGSFQTRVVDLKLMPPISRPALSLEEMAKIKCWLADGAQNN